jgi:hypothetical protein
LVKQRHYTVARETAYRSEATKLCKCCGHPLPDDGPESALTPMQRRLFRILKIAGQRGVSGPELVDLLYQEDANGGSDSLNIVAVMRSNMLPRLAPFGLTIKSRIGRYGCFYLAPLQGH